MNLRNTIIIKSATNSKKRFAIIWSNGSSNGYYESSLFYFDGTYRDMYFFGKSPLDRVKIIS